MDLLEGNNGVRERELLLYFERAEVRKKRQMAIEEEEERYIYLLAPNGHRTQGVG